MENLTVKIEGDQKELLIRTGDALPAKEPKIINITGNILAPGAWLKIRSCEPSEDNVQYSRNDMKIIFVQSEENHYNKTIIGKLELNEDLKRFSINTEKMWTTAELAKFLKMNRLFFADADQCGKIIVELNSLKAKIQTEIEQSQNDRGNSKSMVNTKIESNIPLKFKLKLPVFIGFATKTFVVEICLETSSAGVQLWLESAELNEIIIGERDRILDAEIAKFVNAGLPVIEY